ncbi:hypothetical protein [Sphingosinicella sp. BN140058]|uniref:hypothetical protein n=1 Tax=Sphingosinicella sp. BN140058 TaxID=1892855 RepID=UPI001011A9CE|nr:hypothetical protein [Sphingosinicella sp. BN140058]QAY76593.1 hypothetical protein ETR14_08865 [Sphingosinicella sp. BN140058]
MASRDELSRFIRSSFRSVWSLELLLLLKRDRRRWTHDEIVAGLRGSELIVNQSVGWLSAAGLIVADEDGSVTYAPVSEEVGEFVDAAEQLYARRPDAVRRMIVDASAGGLAAFADAFRFRKD